MEPIPLNKSKDICSESANIITDKIRDTNPIIKNIE